MKSLYLALKGLLEDLVPELKHVAKFNNQFDRMEQGNEKSFAFPCAFIEFADKEPMSLPGRLQMTEMTVRIHLGFESYEDEELDVYDLKDKIFDALEGYSMEGVSSFFRVEDEEDTDHEAYQVYIQGFKTRYVDHTAFVEKKMDFVEGVTLEIEKDLEIDNIEIRTGEF